MGKYIRTVTNILPAILLAYLITIFINGFPAALLLKTPDVEVVVPMLTCAQVGPDYEPELIKAQSVIARSNLYRYLESGMDFPEILGEIRGSFSNTYQDFLFSGQIYEKAAEATRGQVAVWKNALVLLPYHGLSSGKTRDGTEVFHSEEYAYLQSVDSSVDKNAPDYLKSTYVAISQMPQSLIITQRDSAGYITSLTADGHVLEGEAFCQGMYLASSNFSIQKTGEGYRFLSKGKGHGLGLSQYGGNMLAKEGSSYDEILESYFPKLTLVDIYSIFAEK